MEFNSGFKGLINSFTVVNTHIFAEAQILDEQHKI